MYELAIINGMVVDTIRKLKKVQNIGIEDGKIAYIGTEPIAAKRVIDAENQIVSPGFIDVHGHIDGFDYSGELSACQGITSTIGGNCGLSPISMKDFFAEQKRRGFYINQAELIGHSFSLRKAVGIIDPYQKASIQESEQMEAMAEKGLLEGAVGISLGLDYSPGASLEEIERMARLCHKYKRILTVHTRLFTEHDMYSLYEMISIAKKTKCRMLFSHFIYQYCNGTTKAALDIFEEAKKEGLDLWVDSGMYTDWTTYISTATFNEETIIDSGYVLGDMLVATGEYTGHRLDQKIYQYLREYHPMDSVICFTGKKEEVYQVLQKDYAMVSTDIGAYEKGEGHPQIAGTYPKYLKEMVRERKLLSVEEALAKATWLPAKTFQIPNKGNLAVGMDADITIFDLASICDRAEFPNIGKPDAKPDGISYVFVNGKAVVDQGVFTGERAGNVLMF